MEKTGSKKPSLLKAKIFGTVAGLVLGGIMFAFMLLMFGKDIFSFNAWLFWIWTLGFSYLWGQRVYKKRRRKVLGNHWTIMHRGIVDGFLYKADSDGNITDTTVQFRDTCQVEMPGSYALPNPESRMPAVISKNLLNKHRLEQP